MRVVNRRSVWLALVPVLLAAAAGAVDIPPVRVVTTPVEERLVRQTVERDEEVLFTALVTIVAIGESGAPARLPAAFRRNLH